MKNKTNILFIIFILATTVFISCKRDTYDPYFGEQACPDENFIVTSPFTVNKGEGETVDFTTNDSLYFKADFSAKANWKIIVTGEASHATYTFEGFSSSIDTAWYGRSGGNLFFSDEKIKIKFQVICKPELTINQSTSMIKTNFAFDPNIKLVTNFNATSSVFPSSWLFYEDSDPLYGSGKADTVWCKSTSDCSTYLPSQEGGGYLSFIGRTPIPLGESKNVYGSYEVYPPSLTSLPSDPKQVWFNFLANTEGVPLKVIITFKHWNGTNGFGRKVLSINTDKWTNYSINLGQLDKGLTDEIDFDAKNTGIIIMTFIQSGGIAPTIFNIDIPNFTTYSSYHGSK